MPESTFAKLCGVSPLDASSGKQERHRLNRSGDRQANSALWHIVFTRMVNDPRTRNYIERRMKDGRTKKEAIRRLKRYVAREVFAALGHAPHTLTTPPSGMGDRQRPSSILAAGSVGHFHAAPPVATPYFEPVSESRRA